jgi:hypothetical protein
MTVAGFWTHYGHIGIIEIAHNAYAVRLFECCGGGVNAIAMLFANTLTHAVGGSEQFLAGLSARG